MAYENIQWFSELVERLAVSTADEIQEMRNTDKELVEAVAELKRGGGREGSCR